MPPRGGETTIHDIARHLNVSATTVWRAINDRPRVSPETRKRVLSEVKRLGYRPSLVAQTLSWGRTQTLGVVVPTIGNPVHAALVRAVEQAAFERDFSIILCDTNFDLDREQHYFDLLIRRRVDGVLLVPFVKQSKSNEHLRLTQAGITLVGMQQKLTSDEVPQVIPDNFGAARDMTRHLIRLGHRRIAFLHGGVPRWYISMNERLDGYRDALVEAGLTVNPNFIVEVGSFEAILSDQEGELYAERVESLLRGKNSPTALFVPVDVLALRVMSLVRNMGLRIPEDVAIAGFDDIQMSAFAEPPLTTVRHPAEEVGRRAASLLFDQLAGNIPGKKSELQRVPCELVIRRSCGMQLGKTARKRRAPAPSS